jgi:hypothetical protein
VHGVGPLTGFVTSTSPNNGHSLLTGGPFGNGATDKGGGADRQWMTFVDDHTVLLSYNQHVPRDVVVQRSTDGGLTYGPNAAPNPRFRPAPCATTSATASSSSAGTAGRRAATASTFPCRRTTG